MRSRLALTAAAGLLLTLSACTATGGGGGDVADSTSGGNCEAPAAGGASNGVTVDGELGAKPEVNFDFPLTVEKMQRTVVIDGEGPVAREGDTVTAEITLLDGATGDEILSSGHDGSAPEQITLDESFVPAIVKTLECSPAGTRIVSVAPSGDFGENSQQPLVQEGSSAVIIADLVAIADPPLERAEGEVADVPTEFPKVELDEDGAPTITVPDEPAPTELEIAPLIVGDGPTVEEGASVTVHYTGVIWDSNEVFDSSWERGEPATFPTDGVIPGFKAALVGQKVGSQVIAVIPPSEGYGEAGSGELIKGDSVLVFVVDILATN
ncbi:peptidylprolyl isomerase [Diaminobutyricimonas aerilata]|uniref:peptidylprolyl isomerase n=1 Tax=Diaminobutyricimonas aerilata TaxID=1162967 RepID=A0A2M9CLB3_9MICO|nr:FKBP-type peptidyl-prolyl cis-trans isomerase [Diaminobutyricimonas aerilata]PJJ72688.1 peptidylprolyl isomerase [Diaminobutyricimonas aerilata]